MQYINLCLEIELDSDPTAAIVKIGPRTFDVNNTSNNWYLDDVKIFADTVVLDSSAYL